MFAKIARQWQAFKHDEPGHRFEHQRDRMRKEGRGLLVAAAILGALILAGGVVLLFIPGPGLLLIVFGLALIAGVSKTLARALDRAEPIVRRIARRAQIWWRTAHTPAKVAVVALGFVLVAAAGFAAYWVWLR